MPTSRITKSDAGEVRLAHARGRRRASGTSAAAGSSRRETRASATRSFAVKHQEHRHEIATLRGALIEIAHRLERLYRETEAPALLSGPPREIIHTHRTICPDCRAISGDADFSGESPPVRDVFGVEVYFTPTEAAIMRLLLKHQGKPVSFERLAFAIYDSGVRPRGHRKDYVDDPINNLRTYVLRLRKKIRAAGAPAEIASHHGFGVELRATAAKAA